MIRPSLAALRALHAPDVPRPADDGRLKTVRYEASEVVRVQGRRGFQSMIEFGAEERIENVAVGDSAAWQVTPNKRANMLFVKPILPDARTNMTVVTDRRTYLFDLVTAPAKADPVYALRFSNPPAPRPSTEPTAPVLKAEAPPTLPPLRHHYGWTAKGDAALLPARTYDDGVTTYLAWPARRRCPPSSPRPRRLGSPGELRRQGRRDRDRPGAPVLVLRAGDKRAVLTRTPPVTQVAER
jgi:type IV secretion system protein VirB9